MAHDATAAAPIDWRHSFRARSYLVLLGFCIWTGIISVRLYVVMVARRGDYLSRYTAESWRTGSLPALRGRILDQTGRPLAWSTRTFALKYEVPADHATLTAELRKIGGVLAIDTTTDELASRQGERVVLRQKLEPGEILLVRQLGLPHLKVVSHFERRYTAVSPEVVEIIGQTRMIGQKEIGLSGLERIHDRRLRGSDGKYQVMIDKSGNWVAETWMELTPPTQGTDIYLDTTAPP